LNTFITHTCTAKKIIPVKTSFGVNPTKLFVSMDYFTTFSIKLDHFTLDAKVFKGLKHSCLTLRIGKPTWEDWLLKNFTFSIPKKMPFSNSA